MVQVTICNQDIKKPHTKPPLERACVPIRFISQKESFFAHKVGVFSWNSLIMRHWACGPFRVTTHCQFSSTWALVRHWYIATRTKITKRKSSLAKICTLGRLLGPWRPDCTRSGFLNSFSRHVLFRNSNNVAPKAKYNVSLWCRRRINNLSLSPRA